MREEDRLTRYEQVVLPHLDAAYNLARWLARNDHDAEDVVQEACLRAYRFLGGFHGVDGRAWLLAIVRNTCYTWLDRNRSAAATPFDEERHSGSGGAASPDSALLQSEDREMLRRALERLPDDFREVIVLRELEGLSYKEIAAVTGAPLGTVMSRLARARDRLQESLTRRPNKEPES